MLKINSIRDIVSDIITEYLPDYSLKFDLYKMTYRSDLVKNKYISVEMIYSDNNSTPDISISYGAIGNYDPMVIYNDGIQASINEEIIKRISIIEPYVAAMMTDLCEEVGRLIRNNS